VDTAVATTSAPALFLASADVLRLAVPGSLVTLDGAEGRHAARVRRIAVGERVNLGDGAGAIAECVTREVGRDHLLLEVGAVRQVPAPQPRLVVVQALPKGDRGELAVELMTEVGVDVIVPWPAARCVAQWRGERGVKALERWRSTAREAAKQARRAWLPDVTEPASTEQVRTRLASAALAVVLHGPHGPAGRPLADVDPPAASAGEVVAVVGPEGGLAPHELAAFAGVGALPTRLGPTVLRASTAGVAALAVLAARTGRWSV
jgi:16S rRNA (uracil1498-N3)-methyltransferase